MLNFRTFATELVQCVDPETGEEMSGSASNVLLLTSKCFQCHDMVSIFFALLSVLVVVTTIERVI